MEEQQKGVCLAKFTELEKRVEKIEIHDSEKQDEKLNMIDKMMVRFEMMFESQNETNKQIFERQEQTTNSILEKFAEYREENKKTGQERDGLIKELSDNMLKISDGMTQMNQKMEKNDKKMETIDKKIESIDEKSKIDFMVIFKNALISFLLTGFGAGIAYIFLKLN